MKGLIVWIVGVALTASLSITPAVIADENGEVHTWSASSSDEGTTRMISVAPSDRVIQVVSPGMAMAPGTRVYFVSDDPAYDLSGAGDHWFLVGDGTAFHESSWRSPAVFASTGGGTKEVVPVSAEYRQDWLAVAAGDRPVRSFTSPRSVMDVSDMAMAPSSIVYVMKGDNGDSRYSNARYADSGTRYKAHHRAKAKMHRRTSAARYSAVHHRTHRRHRAVAASYRRHRAAPARASYASTRTEVREPMRMAVAQPAEAQVEIRRDEAGNELFQMNSSWYMKTNGDWMRAESWRGPFAHVKKGSVPREVRKSEEHPSRMDMD